MKKCTKCLIEKDLSEFWKNKNFKDWLRYDCNQCRKEYYKKNKEYINKKCREYREENLENIKERHKRYYKENKEKIKQKQKINWPKWAKTENWKISKKISANKRRALEKSSDDWTITTKLIDELLYLQWWECLICWENIVNDYHLDHIVPLSDWWENSRWNVQLLCPSCNISKWNRYNW